MNRINSAGFASVLVFSVLGAALMSPANAAYFDPASGLYMGNVCQTPIGWQIVPTAPVGARCFAPAFGMGVITN